MPWIFFFLAILFLMHVWSGVTLFTERRTAQNLALLEPLRQERAILQDRNNRSAATLKGLGMTGRASAQWELADRKFSEVSSRVTEFISLSGGGGRIFRIFLQSAVLSVGALRVIDASVSPADIEQLNTGQQARVMFSTLNQNVAPELSGTLTFISAERSDDGKGGPPFFRIRVELDRSSIGSQLYTQLRAGTPAEVFLQTGDRSLLSYLFKPLMDQITHAFRQ